MSDFLNQLLPYSAPLVVALFVLYLGVKKYIPKQHLETLRLIAQIAVEAAEQLAKIEAIPSDDRKAYALNLVQKELDQYNIKISESLINAVIEASVTGLRITKKN